MPSARSTNASSRQSTIPPYELYSSRCAWAVRPHVWASSVVESASSPMACLPPRGSRVLLSTSGRLHSFSGSRNRDSLTHVPEWPRRLDHRVPVTDQPGVPICVSFSGATPTSRPPRTIEALAVWWFRADGLGNASTSWSLPRMITSRVCHFPKTLQVTRRVSFVREIAERQLATGGGLPPSTSHRRPRTAADDAMVALRTPQPTDE